MSWDLSSKWFWSADTFVWQLSIDNNMNVKHGLQARLQDQPENVTLHIGFPVVSTDGRTNVRSRDYLNFLDA